MEATLVLREIGVTACYTFRRIARRPGFWLVSILISLAAFGINTPFYSVGIMVSSYMAAWKACQVAQLFLGIYAVIWVAPVVFQDIAGRPREILLSKPCGCASYVAGAFCGATGSLALSGSLAMAGAVAAQTYFAEAPLRPGVFAYFYLVHLIPTLLVFTGFTAAIGLRCRSSAISAVAGLILMPSLAFLPDAVGLPFLGVTGMASDFFAYPHRIAQLVAGLVSYGSLTMWILIRTARVLRPNPGSTRSRLMNATILSSAVLSLTLGAAIDLGLMPGPYTSAPRSALAVREAVAAADVRPRHEIKVEGRVVHAVATPKNAGRLREFVETADDIAEVYTDLFGPLPYDRITIIEGRSLDVNWIASDGWYSYDPRAPGVIVLSKELIASGCRERNGRHSEFAALARVIAEQWWGCALKPKGEGEEWLVRAFGGYSAALALEHLRGKDAAQWWVHERRVSYLSSYHVMKKKDVALLEPAGILYYSYGTKVLDKGTFICYMLDRLVGRDTLVKAMRRYAQEGTSCQGATLAAFVRALETEAQQDLDWFFEQWLRRSELPEYHVRRVECRPANGGYAVSATIENSGATRMPVTVTVVDSRYEALASTRVEIGPGALVTARLLTAGGSPSRVIVDPGREILESRDDPYLWGIDPTNVAELDARTPEADAREGDPSNGA